jgi:hypothetical protein
MNVTLWRGTTLLGHGELHEGNRPGVLHGSILHRTADLELLGPIAQWRFPGGPIVQTALPRASEWVDHSNQGRDEIIASDPALHAHELPPEQLLTVRSADGNEIGTDTIMVMEPPELPEEFTTLLDTATRDHLKLWGLTCHLSSDGNDAA